MNNEDFIQYFRDLLDDNIDDPISQRAKDGKNWVYGDFPRIDATLPRIGLSFTANTYSPTAVGSTNRVETNVLQVSVLCDMKQGKFDVDGDGSLETEEQVARFLERRVKEVFENFQTSIRDDLDIRYALPINSSTIRDEENNVITTSIDIEVVSQ